MGPRKKSNSGRNKNKGRGQQQKSKPQQNAIVPPSIPPAKPPVEAPKGHTGDDRPEKKGSHIYGFSRRDLAQIVFPASLVLFTFVQSIVGGCQWIATRDQYNAMLEQNDVAAEQLRMAMKETAHSHAIMEFMAHEQRAWLMVEGPRTYEIAADRHLTGELTVKNVGKYPATVIRLGATMDIGPTCPFEMEELPPGEEPFTYMPKTQVTIPPGADRVFETPGDVALSDREVVEINNGETKLWLMIVVSYTDATGFGHATQGCFVYSPKYKAFAEHSEHNQMQ